MAKIIVTSRCCKDLRIVRLWVSWYMMSWLLMCSLVMGRLMVNGLMMSCLVVNWLMMDWSWSWLVRSVATFHKILECWYTILVVLMSHVWMIMGHWPIWVVGIHVMSISCVVVMISDCWYIN